MPKYENKCPVNFEMDLYDCCSFNCVYCITESRKKQIECCNTSNTSLTEFLSENNNSKNPVYFSPWTDAYQHSEKNENRTRHAISAAVELGIPFFIITRSPLVLRDIDILKKSDNCFVAVSLNTIDEDIINRLEPRACSSSERISTIRELVKKKIKTVIKIDPVIPGITDGKRLDNLLHKITEIRPYAVTMETLRLTKKISEKMRFVLTNDEFSKMISFYNSVDDEPIHPLIDYRMDIFSETLKFFKTKGIKIAFCKASLPKQLSEIDCRGGF